MYAISFSSALFLFFFFINSDIVQVTKNLASFTPLKSSCSWKCGIHGGTNNQCEISNVSQFAWLLGFIVFAWSWLVALSFSILLKKNDTHV